MESNAAIELCICAAGDRTRALDGTYDTSDMGVQELVLEMNDDLFRVVGERVAQYLVKQVLDIGCVCPIFRAMVTFAVHDVYVRDAPPPACAAVTIHVEKVLPAVSEVLPPTRCPPQQA